eukprot:gene38842-52466_t
MPILAVWRVSRSSDSVRTVAMLGGVVDCLAFTKSKVPTLVLEIGADSTHSFIVSPTGVDASRPIPQGLDAMVPIVQKELGLKDEESARKLFYSNTFDFTGMGPLLIKRLLKELQSSIGFYEVQTGQSVGQVLCTQLSPKLAWLDAAIAGSLGAKRLLFLTDVDGVLGRDKKLIPELTVRDARSLIADGTISGGMIPKVETCLEALENGVEGVVILNGKTPHVVLVELFTEHGAGTLIVR